MGIIISPRLGPSASQVPDDKITELARVMNLLHKMMNEPWAKDLIQKSNVVAKTELQDAQDGKPAPSAPVKTPVLPPGDGPTLPAPSKEELPVTPETPTTVAETPPEVEPSAPTDVPGTERPVVINTSTHRAHYARLVRKMEGLDETDAPNMHRMFTGSRKDRYD